jgi:hypothetical protein
VEQWSSNATGLKQVGIAATFVATRKQYPKNGSEHNFSLKSQRPSFQKIHHEILRYFAE